MAITKVQSTTATGASKAYGSNNTAGNLLLCIVWGASGSTSDPGTTVPTDSKSNTWHLAINAPNNWSIFYAMNCAGGANTVTPAAAVAGYEIAEFSGCATTSALDQTASGGGGSFPIAVTTLFNGELIIGCQTSADTSIGGCSTPPTITVGSGLTSDQNPLSTHLSPYPHSYSCASGYEVQGSAGSFSMAKWTTSGACSGPAIQDGVVATFKAAAAASTFPDPGGMMMGGMG